jgi:mRNA interferase MazF
MQARPQFFRGEIWEANLDPVAGREQEGSRPVLIISDDYFNLGPLDMAIVLPITKTLRGWPSRVPIAKGEGGLPLPSEIQCDQMRTIDIIRLRNPYGSAISPATMAKVEYVLRMLLGL